MKNLSANQFALMSQIASRWHSEDYLETVAGGTVRSLLVRGYLLRKKVGAVVYISLTPSGVLSLKRYEDLEVPMRQKPGALTKSCQELLRQTRLLRQRAA